MVSDMLCEGALQSRIMTTGGINDIGLHAQSVQMPARPPLFPIAHHWTRQRHRSSLARLFNRGQPDVCVLG
jgi:hypothetical protein